MKVFVLSLALFFAVVTTSAAQVRLRTCYRRFDMPHEGVLIPFSEPSTLKVSLYLSFSCSRTGRAIGSKKPVVVLMPGALTRPKDYTRIGNRLARQGFLVALPDYNRRDLVNVSPAFGPIGTLIEERRSMGFKCPKRPQFATTKLISR